MAVAWVTLALLLGLAGCGGERTYPVRGVVTFEGKPLPGGGSIRFVPLGEQAMREAGGNIAQDGSYELNNAEGVGALAGEYRVEVIQNLILQPAVYPDQSEAGSGERPRLAPTTPEVRVPAADVIPRVYSGEQSPLQATIQKQINMDVNFDLKRQP